VVQTDHKPLVYAFHQRSDKASLRQLQHLDFIGQFTTAIKHISGENNVVANTFSRIDEVYTPSIIEPEELAEQQESDPQLKEMLSTNTTGLKLKRLTPSHTETAQRNTSAPTYQPLYGKRYSTSTIASRTQVAEPRTRSQTKNLNYSVQTFEEDRDKNRFIYMILMMTFLLARGKKLKYYKRIILLLLLS
jgi:hypothetical protein